MFSGLGPRGNAVFFTVLRPSRVGVNAAENHGLRATAFGSRLAGQSVADSTSASLSPALLPCIADEALDSAGSLKIGFPGPSLNNIIHIPSSLNPAPAFVFHACSNMATQGKLDAAQASDISQLWQQAVKNYEKKTKKSLHLAQFSNIDQIMKGTEGLSSEFKDFRHDRSKTDNVRTALKNNLWLIQKVVNTVEVVGNAASVCSLMWNSACMLLMLMRLTGLPPRNASQLDFHGLWTGHAGTKPLLLSIRDLDSDKAPSLLPRYPPTMTRSWGFSTSRIASSTGSP